MSENKIEYKVILIGNTAVGKTSLFKKLTTGVFSDKNISTIGVDKKTLSVQIPNVNKEIDISLVDTAGQERFRSIAKKYYQGCDGILLLYDITNKDSFKQIENWIESIHESIGNHKNSKYIIILIGNKKDLITEEGFQREVTEEEAKTTCEERSFVWGGETSVRNIEYNDLLKLFAEYVKDIYDKVGEKVIKKQVSKSLDKYKSKKKKKFICI